MSSKNRAITSDIEEYERVSFFVTCLTQKLTLLFDGRGLSRVC